MRTFNMGYEGFSRPHALVRMHPVLGNRGEYLLLLALFGLVPLFRNSRKNNEEALRDIVKTTNRYELVENDRARLPSTWTMK